MDEIGEWDDIWPRRRLLLTEPLISRHLLPSTLRSGENRAWRVFDTVSLKPDRSSVAGRQQATNKPCDIVGPCIQGLDEFRPIHASRVAGVGTVDRHELKPPQRRPDRRQWIAFRAFHFEPVAEIERYSHVGATTCLRKADGVCESFEPEPGVRIKGDAQPVAGGNISESPQSFHDQLIAHWIGRSDLRTVPSRHSIDGEPKGCVRTFEHCEPALQFAREPGIRLVALKHEVAVEEFQPLLPQHARHFFVESRPAKAGKTRFLQQGCHAFGRAFRDGVHGEKFIRAAGNSGNKNNHRRQNYPGGAHGSFLVDRRRS